MLPHFGNHTKVADVRFEDIDAFMDVLKGLIQPPPAAPQPPRKDP